MNSSLVPYIPVEIVEVILRYADGKTLGRAPLVCTAWQAIFHRLKKTNVWKRICKEELSHDKLLEVVNHMYPASRTSDEDFHDEGIDWYQIYKVSQSFHLVGRLQLPPRDVQSFTHCKQNVNCVKTTGTCMVIGLEDGMVQAWSHDGVLLGVLTVHERAVTDIALLSFFCDVPFSVWDVNHEHVVSTSDDMNVQINSICPRDLLPSSLTRRVLRGHAGATIMVRSHENNFVVMSAIGHLSVWNLKPPVRPFEAPIVIQATYVQLQTLGCIALSTVPTPEDGLLVTGISPTGQQLKVRLSSRNAPGLLWTQQVGRKPKVEQPTTPLPYSQAGRTLRAGYVWRDKVYAWITSEGKLSISLDGEQYQEFVTMPHLQAVPTCVLIFSKLLMLGLDSGGVAVYYFDSPRDLLSLNFGQVHHMVQMGSEPVVKLDISVSMDGTVMLLAASNFKIHTVCLM